MRIAGSVCDSGEPARFCAVGAELIQQVQRAGADEAVRIVQQRRDRADRRRAARLQAVEADGADVHRRRAQRGDLSLDRVGVERRRPRHEALRRDAVDGAGRLVVEILVAADARVDPVGDVDRAVGADRDVGRTEQRRHRAGDAAAAAEEVRPGVLLLLVRGDEDLPVEREVRAGRLRLVGEDLVAAGFGREERALPRRAERAVLVEHVAGRRAAAVDVAERRHARVVLPPLGHRRRLPRPAIRLPACAARRSTRSRSSRTPSRS